MTENGVLPLPPEEASDMAALLRAAGAALGILRMPEDPCDM